MGEKKILIITVLFCLLIAVNCQIKRKFDYQQMSSGNFIVTPVFKQKEAVGNQGIPFVLDNKYKNDLFTDPVKEVLSKEKKDSLHRDTEVRVIFDVKGEIISCDFIVDARDKTLLTENDLNNLYLRYKQIKVDLSKIRIDPDPYSKEKSADYAFISNGLISMVQSDFDHINRKEIFLLKTDSVRNKLIMIPFGSMNIHEAGQLFGRNYQTRKVYSNLFDVNYTELVYNDGLILNFPDVQKMDKAFTISSDKYTLLLKNGLKITVGMKSEELMAIFPNSFLRRRVITNSSEMSCNYSFLVYFSFIRDNKEYIEDSFINFILSEENGVLERFYTWEPG